jgi:hypothetical protein
MGKWGRRHSDGQAFPKTGRRPKTHGMAYAPRYAAKRRAKAIDNTPKKLVEERDGNKVYAVDGGYVRDNIDPSFTQGDHPYDEDSWVPDGEIWIDRDVPDRRPLIEHEVYEARRMKKGEPYESAHAAALKHEAVYRESDPALDR